MSENNWTSLIAVVQVLGTAFIAYLVIKVREVKKIVDGPLSVALKANAELAAKLAEITKKPEDMMAAAKAQIIDENRQEGKTIV